MKLIRRLLRLTGSRILWRGAAEFAGFGMLVAAAWLANEIAGVAALGAVLLNYAYAGGGREE